ncbi:hypothetical protein ACQZ48_03095 [Agrobacterium sp. 22-209-1]
MSDPLEQKLADFLDALDEWGCNDNLERAKEILDFQRCGCDLSEYVEHDEGDRPLRAKSEVN